MKNLPTRFKVAISSFLPPVILGVLILFTSSVSFSKIGDINQKLDSAQKDFNTLSAKQVALSQIASTAQTNSVVASAALPAENSVGAVLSQLRILAANNALVLGSVKSSIPIKGEDGVTKADIQIEIDGIRPLVVNFLESIPTIAPISYVSSVKMNESGGEVHAAISVTTFWAEYPKNLPPITQMVSDLTPLEQTVFDSISGLAQPQFLEVPPSTQLQLNQNPFGI